MSSSPRGRRPWSLRRRLIAQVAGLLALVCLVVGVVTELALRDILMDQLDARIAETSERASRPPPSGRPGGDRVPEGLRAYGQSTGSLFVNILPDGRVVAAVLRSSYDAKVADPFPHDPIGPAQLAALLRSTPTDKPTDVELGSLGEYRVVAKQASNGGVAITGLPTKDVKDTLWNLGFIFGGVAVGGIVLAGALGAVTVRRTMKPLDRLAATATRVAELPLDRGEVALSERVSEVDTDPRTEVGKVGFALNRMLGHISHALSARQASETRVRRFVADASHELRTPLAVIRTELDVTLADEYADEAELRRMAGVVRDATERAERLVGSLLLLARTDGAGLVAREPVDLAVIVASAWRAVRAEAEKRGIRTEFATPGAPTFGDPALLERIAGNLLENAVRHNVEGGWLDVVTQAGPQWSVLRVRSSGGLLDPAAVPELFEPFRRAGVARTARTGAGLGLSIVRAAVQAHGGTVSAEPVVGGGLSVTVHLPALP